MKIRVGLGIATAIGAIVAAGLVVRVGAQVPTNPPMPSGADAYWNMNQGGLQEARMPPQGSWAEVINVTSRWMVVQNQSGQQFPIASDRVRQFLIRWPYSTDQIGPQSMIELTGPEAGSNVIIADHLDVYENEAQALVSPAVNYMSGYNRVVSSFDVDQMNTYGTIYWMSPEEYAIPNRTHVVGRSFGPGNDPVRISGFGQNWFTVQPSVNGMTVTQVTMGTNTYARRGDVVYVVPENLSPRSLDVSQLVLYKKIPLRAFQP